MGTFKASLFPHYYLVGFLLHLFIQKEQHFHYTMDYFSDVGISDQSVIHFIILLSLFIGIAIAQVKAIHIYKNPKSKIHFYLTVGVFVIIFMCFVIFTFNAPHLPLFHDALTGNYGISV